MWVRTTRCSAPGWARARQRQLEACSLSKLPQDVLAHQNISCCESEGHCSWYVTWWLSQDSRVFWTGCACKHTKLQCAVIGGAVQDTVQDVAGQICSKLALCYKLLWGIQQMVRKGECIEKEP